MQGKNGASGALTAAKRKPRRLLEAEAALWKRWDRWAKLEGVSWSTFARRALEQRGSSIEDLVGMANENGEAREGLLMRLPGLSEKPTPKTAPARREKRSVSGGRRKG